MLSFVHQSGGNKSNVVNKSEGGKRESKNFCLRRNLKKNFQKKINAYAAFACKGCMTPLHILRRQEQELLVREKRFELDCTQEK